MEPMIDIWAVVYHNDDREYIAGTVRDIHFYKEDADKDLADAKEEGYAEAEIKHFQYGQSDFFKWIKEEFQGGWMELEPKYLREEK